MHGAKLGVDFKKVDPDKLLKTKIKEVKAVKSALVSYIKKRNEQPGHLDPPIHQVEENCNQRYTELGHKKCMNQNLKGKLHSCSIQR